MGEEREKKMKKFVKENESKIKEFGMLKKFDDSKKFMMDGMTHLACDETANYLVIWCLDLEMEEKHELMAHVAHQCICMQYLLELAKQLETDPRACISSFFTKIQVADEEYKSAFYSELEAFKERIKKRAAEKIDEARYHMKRCVDSGLWVPSSEDPRTSTGDGFVKAPVEEEEEEVYDEVK